MGVRTLCCGLDKAVLAHTCLPEALSLFIFAATARPGVHWFWPCFSLWLFTVFLIPIYVTVNTYLSDSYETYASSALSSSGKLSPLSTGLPS